MKKIVLLFATLLLSATSMAQVVITEPQPADAQPADAQPAAPRLTIKERLARPAQVDSLTVVNETVVVQEPEKKSGDIVRNAKAQGADMIVTACPPCRYNLMKNGADIPVIYFTELLAEALGVKEDTNE